MSEGVERPLTRLNSSSSDQRIETICQEEILSSGEGTSDIEAHCQNAEDKTSMVALHPEFSTGFTKLRSLLESPDRKMTVKQSETNDKEDLQFRGENSNTSASETIPSELQLGPDFGYSQRYFHISDGNLYSVFSPLQGRSYGVTPSFLRKRGYAIRGSRGKGRRNQRRGLKFHNFIPSESITSERDEKTADDVWKVHAECRLREEHGSKQIMVSHWSLSSSSPSGTNPVPSNLPSSLSSSDGATSEESREFSYEQKPQEHSMTSKNRENLNNIYSTPEPQSSPHSLPLLSCRSSHGTSSVVDKILFHKLLKKDLEDSQNFIPVYKETSVENMPMCKQNSLSDSVVNVSNQNTQGVKSDANYSELKPSVGEGIGKNVFHEGEEEDIVSERKHKRKPLHTRRVVPYFRYLSMIEGNQDVPLDLSCKQKPNCDNTCFVNNSSSVTRKLNTLEKHMPPFLPISRIPSQHAGNSKSSTSFGKIMPNNTHLTYPLGVKNKKMHLGKTPSSRVKEVELSKEEDVTPTSLPYIYTVEDLVNQTDLPVISLPSLSDVQPSNSFLASSLHNSLCNKPGNTDQLAHSIVEIQGSPYGALPANQSSSSLPSGASNIFTSSASSFNNLLSLPSTSTSQPNTHFMCQETALRSNFRLPKNPRKASQRTIIKQKLEDAFRQNGFLVQTKQVSDGDATFCKFRQLRKYTRYYLKSWHQHLPDEVHKLWKGFLPPKTALPHTTVGTRGEPATVVCPTNSSKDKQMDEKHGQS
ncbi:uncharacterized protein LOC111087831 [Limulus polyphemus]|uniref:Uncharacterized protein LOC111087831 n=1 Tax=Limulus polyphemus TaxID=6850 RepID=A0ABM1T6V3_LIMPO|nr:uncharacterized protein LOC111087831 [Limulus polyphemus]XP_022251609.1 uncharacterized protein LOC111087831 [Limulus polyphemus]